MCCVLLGFHVLNQWLWLTLLLSRFRATLYPCPETQAERREMAIGVMTRIEDLNTVSMLLCWCLSTVGTVLVSVSALEVQ